MNFLGLRAGYPLYPHQVWDAVLIPKPSLSLYTRLRYTEYYTALHSVSHDENFTSAHQHIFKLTH